jgi:hypothetical protein
MDQTIFAVALAVGLGVAVVPFGILVSSASPGAAWLAVAVTLLAIVFLPLSIPLFNPEDPGCSNDCGEVNGYLIYAIWILGGAGWLLGVLLGGAVRAVRHSEAPSSTVS